MNIEKLSDSFCEKRGWFIRTLTYESHETSPNNITILYICCLATVWSLFLNVSVDITED